MRDWLKQSRLEKGLTQAQVAEELHISESYYAFIENGDRQKKMDIPIAAKLSVVLGLPLDRIVALENSAPEP